MKRVKVFTASGTFRGQEGEVVRTTSTGAFVRLDSGGAPLHFSRGELVHLDEPAMVAGD